MSDNRDSDGDRKGADAGLRSDAAPAKPRFDEQLSFWLSSAEFAELIGVCLAIDAGGRFVPAWFVTPEPAVADRLEDLAFTEGNRYAVMWNPSRSHPLVLRRTLDGSEGYLSNPDGIELRHWSPLPGVVSGQLNAPGLVAGAKPGETYLAPSDHTWRVWAALEAHLKRVAPRVKGTRERVSPAAKDIVLATPGQPDDVWSDLQEALRANTAKPGPKADGAKTKKRTRTKADGDEPDVYKAAETDADYAGADLRGRVWERCVLTGVRFAGANLAGAGFRWSTLEECDFAGVDLRGADLNSSEFRSCSFAGANLQDADVSGSAFENCDFTGADRGGIRGQAEGI